MDAEREGLALGNEARHPEAPSRQGPELRGCFSELAGARAVEARSEIRNEYFTPD
jgi:hypothetical protein